MYILLSHDEIILEEIQQKLNSPETFEDFKRLCVLGDDALIS